MELLKNFEVDKNNISYFGGVSRIGDFSLYKKDSEKIIKDAKVGYTIYGIKNIEELKNSDKNITIVIPALTGNSRIFDTKSSQGTGWANTYGKPGNILDPNNDIIIGLDYFGGPYDSSRPGKHDLDFYPVPPEKQVEAWKKALSKLGVEKINILFGGSNGGGHIHNWIFDDEFQPKYLISVAGPIAPTDEAKEFFKLQIDFIEKKEDVSKRLVENLKNLKSQSDLYDELIKETILEIKESIKSNNNKELIKVARQIGFLKFVNPEYFDKFYFDKKGEKYQNLQDAKTNMMNYFKYEGEKFEKRFGLASLLLLLKGIVDAERINPEEYVNKISKKIELIIISIQDDNLFESEPMQKYFKKVQILREKNQHLGKTIFEKINSDENTRKSGHDGFLWPKIIQKISDKIINILK